MAVWCSWSRVKIRLGSFSRHGLTAALKHLLPCVLFEVDAVDQLEGIHWIHIPALIVLCCHQLYPLYEQRIKKKNEDRKNNQPPILANHYQSLCMFNQVWQEIYTKWIIWKPGLHFLYFAMRSGSTSLNRLRFDRLPVFLFFTFASSSAE